MQRDDLPLLAWRPSKQVLLFPLIKRVSKVRHTARMLSGKQGDDAALYWKQVTAANRKHLARVGLDDSEIDAQLQAFFDAVQNEMVRQSYSGRHGGGAA